MFAGAASRCLLACAFSVLACARRPPAEPAPAKTPGVSAQRADTSASQVRFGGSFGDALLQRQGLRLPLPDRSRWHESASSTWSVLSHDATESRLMIKLWRAPRLVQKEECADMARLGQPAIVILGEDELVERRRFAAPAAFDAELWVGVREQGGALHGFAQVFGATVGRCYAAAFETVTRGPGRERELGRRLTLIVETALAGVRILSIEQRIEGEPPPAGL